MNSVSIRILSLCDLLRVNFNDMLHPEPSAPISFNSDYEEIKRSTTNDGLFYSQTHFGLFFQLSLIHLGTNSNVNERWSRWWRCLWWLWKDFRGGLVFMVGILIAVRHIGMKRKTEKLIGFEVLMNFWRVQRLEIWEIIWSLHVWNW